MRRRRPQAYGTGIAHEINDAAMARDMLSACKVHGHIGNFRANAALETVLHFDARGLCSLLAECLRIGNVAFSFFTGTATNSTDTFWSCDVVSILRRRGDYGHLSLSNGVSQLK